jgi:hypothetical protein
LFQLLSVHTWTHRNTRPEPRDTQPRRDVAAASDFGISSGPAR